MRARFVYSETIASCIRSFWFEPEQAVDYVAGQFTQIHLPHTNTDDRGDKRWFTISSAPTCQRISITTKFSQPLARGSSFKRALAALEPGTQLNLADPMGDFVLPKNKDTSLLFVAGGMGITPMHSMITWLQDIGETRQIDLVYGVSHGEELAWRDVFESSKINFTPIVKHPTPNLRSQTGSLSSQRIAQLASSNSPESLVYLSGPEVMIEQFVDELPKLGIANERLVTDYFPGYPKI